jgi:hypothetical protein
MGQIWYLTLWWSQLKGWVWWLMPLSFQPRGEKVKKTPSQVGWYTPVVPAKREALSRRITV